MAFANRKQILRVTRGISLSVFLALCPALPRSLAETPPLTPEVLMCVPLGGVAGQTIKVKARGLNLESVTEVRCNIASCTTRFLSAGKATIPASLNAKQAGDSQVEFELTIAAEVQLPEVGLTFVASSGEVVARLSVAGPTIEEVEPNPGFKQAQSIVLSQVVLGQIERPQDVDVFAINLTDAAFVRISVAAQNHGSALDSLLSLYDASGTLIISNDDRGPSRDSLIEYQVSRTDRYFVVVQDANDLGGEAQPYRLSIEPAMPPVSFVRQIAPILQQHCVSCHGPHKSEGGYRVDTFEHLMAAGDSGQHGFVAQTLDKSESFRRLTLAAADERMPLQRAPLTASEIALVQVWLQEGCRFDGSSASSSLLSQMPPVVHPPSPPFYASLLPVTAIAFTPGGTELLVGGYHEITAWNPENGTLVRRIGNVAERTYKIAMHPMDDLFAIACGNPGQLGEVRIFTTRGELQKVLSASSDVVHDVAFSPSGDRLAIAGSDATIRIVDLSHGGVERVISSHLDWVLAVAWSPDGRKLASASRDKTAKVFAADTGQLLASYARHEAPVRGIMFHPSGEEIYTGGANQRWDRWQIAEAKHVRDMNLGGEAFKLYSFGSYFLVPSGNNRVHLMKAAESDRIREFQGTGANRFLSVSAHESTDRVAAGTQQGHVIVWELSTGKQVSEFSVAPRVHPN